MEYETPDIHSTGLIRMHKVEGFAMTFVFPTGTSHTSRTMVLTIENKKSGKLFTFNGPAANRIVVQGHEITVTIPPSETGTEGVALSKLIESGCIYGFDVYSTTILTSPLVSAFRGDIEWVGPRGAFNES
jgi:hypothetical protein